jgi:transglutaminase/protease-like cytokinesis protein 3
MRIRDIPHLPWIIVAVVLFSLVNVIARPRPQPRAPSADIISIVDRVKWESSDQRTQQQEQSQQVEPLPTPTAQSQQSDGQAVLPEPTAAIQPTPDSTQQNTTDSVVFMPYTEGMQVSTAIEVRETLHTAIRARTPQYSVVFAGTADELAKATRYVNTLDDSQSLERVSLAAFPRDVRVADGANPSIVVELMYTVYDEQAAYVDRRQDEILAEIITPSMSDYDKVKAVHDWIVLNIEYDLTYQNSFPYEALKTGKVVCYGYALLTYQMLEKVGVRTLLIVGPVRDEYLSGGSSTALHGWNMVLIDGEWYQYDATWDDPVPDEKGRVRYDFFLISDENMLETRTFMQDQDTYLRPVAQRDYPDDLGDSLFAPRFLQELWP